MDSVNAFLTLFASLPSDHLAALIALVGMGVAALSVWVVYLLARERGGRR